jgi:hypothetical protein
MLPGSRAGYCAGTDEVEPVRGSKTARIRDVTVSEVARLDNVASVEERPSRIAAGVDRLAILFRASCHKLAGRGAVFVFGCALSV